MHFTHSLVALATMAATLVNANTITFINQDSTSRTIVFTGNSNVAKLPNVVVPGNRQVRVTFPNAWVGNAYSVSQGQPFVTGMLAEFAFAGWGGITFFDVSAIVNPNDTNGIKQLFPASQLNVDPKTVFSGCENFPCSTAYYHPDDIATVSTRETDLICTLGTPASLKATRDVEPELVERKFVLGQF
ncbi:hypothetical protein GGR50DRAFT_94951 [Xylaria sp. CBS 124048]|nr:hypothetical protein GGR50DRAFT_94951 [Xylaria sp. CBS 124048]